MTAESVEAGPFKGAKDLLRAVTSDEHTHEDAEREKEEPVHSE